MTALLRRIWSPDERLHTAENMVKLSLAVITVLALVRFLGAAR